MMAVFSVALCLSLSDARFSVCGDFSKTWGAFDIKAVFPQLSIDRATNPQVHIPTRVREAKPKRI